MKRILQAQLILTALVVFFSIGVQPTLAQQSSAPSFGVPSYYELLLSTEQCAGCGTQEPIQFQIFSETLERWGAWHKSSGSHRPGTRLVTAFQEVPGFGPPSAIQLLLQSDDGWVGSVRVVNGETTYTIAAPSVSIRKASVILRLITVAEDDACLVEDLDCVISLTASCLPEQGICCKDGVCTCTGGAFCE